MGATINELLTTFTGVYDYCRSKTRREHREGTEEI